ncbi:MULTISPECIES: dihydrolipoyl dehydrogenase [unclassified Duganella]|uniref:dihydrolipoyl dehydrogenase n=1 Tax=unclassified Duganella TaxID=2636909 RepID=UPI000E350D2C|nr:MULTISPECIES: dihydrolipoyl dehydrogenase [unclassified Duganella]RFP08250.1 dihydrolipoyl dehydrogenase [Duganella sp. BJB475]RFP22428.1 dihydrolipoyl dehydrogenase [Duganella sp. BJB476]
MKTLRTEVAVIGAGTAGMTAYRAATTGGKKTLLIESNVYGTTCARVGCMPSKLLIAAAEAAHALHAAPAFGVHPGQVRIDGKAVMARVRSERDRFVGFVVESVDGYPAEDKIRGHARFLSATQLQIDEHTLIEAERFVIATGSTPIVPDEWRAAGPRVITSDDVFYWDDLPASIAVAGTGVIGLELGQALARLGVRVTVFGRGGSVAQLSDPDVLDVARRAMADELDVRFKTKVVRVVPEGDGLAVTSEDGDGVQRTEQFSYLLSAIGRRPNVHKLGLENTGLERDHHGIPLYDQQTMQCGASAIFIAGDADNERPQLPEAADQGRIAGDNAARYPAVQPGLRRTPLTIAFTEPQIATLGASYEELCASYAGRFSVGKVSFENQGRSRVMLQNKGMLRVYAEHATGRFLGAEMIGPRAEHIGHLLSWACQAGLTVSAMLDMPFYHPVVEEGVRTALRDLAHQLATAPAHDCGCIDCTPAP